MQMNKGELESDESVAGEVRMKEVKWKEEQHAIYERDHTHMIK